MKILHFAGDLMTTGDAIADAVLSYAQSLAATESSATVDIPVLLADGTKEQATLLLGPASQLVAIHTPSRYPEVIDEQLVRYITHEAEKIAVDTAVPFTAEQLRQDDLSFGAVDTRDPAFDEGDL